MYFPITYIVALTITVRFRSASAFAPTKIRNHVKPCSMLVGAESHNVRCCLRMSGINPDGIAFISKLNDSNTNGGQDNRSSIKNKPRLASALESTIRWFLQYILIRQCSSIAVNISSPSNRALLLKGKINSLSISIRDCTSRLKLFSFQRLDINGMDLQFGRSHFVLVVLPFLIWRLRRHILVAMLLSSFVGRLESDTHLRQKLESIKRRIHSILDVKPSQVNYSITIGKDDIAQSLVFRIYLNSLLRSLVENSFVGAAAVLGDARQESILKLMKAGRKRQQNVFGLPATSDINATGRTPAKNESARASSNFDYGPGSQQQQQQQGLTSALLSATAFELTNTSFSKGRIVLDAEAVLPSDDQHISKGNEQKLPFTIRAKIEPTSISDSGLAREGQQQQKHQGYHALGFTNPECRLNTTPLTAGTLLGKLIPDIVWLPFGVGIAIPLSKHCQIHRAEVTAGQDMNENGVCRIDASWTVFSPGKCSM